MFNAYPSNTPSLPGRSNCERPPLRPFVVIDKSRVPVGTSDLGAGANMLSFGRFQNAEGFAAALA